MHPKVRDLYKRILFAGRTYPHPQGLEFVKQKAKKEFEKRKDLNNEQDILKAVAYGRYMVREMVAVSQLHKYRTLKDRQEQHQ